MVDVDVVDGVDGVDTRREGRITVSASSSSSPSRLPSKASLAAAAFVLSKRSIERGIHVERKSNRKFEGNCSNAFTTGLLRLMLADQDGFDFDAEEADASLENEQVDDDDDDAVAGAGCVKLCVDDVNDFNVGEDDEECPKQPLLRERGRRRNRGLEDDETAQRRDQRAAVAADDDMMGGR